VPQSALVKVNQGDAFSKASVNVCGQARNRPRDCKTRTGPPDAEKQSPGAAVTATRAKRKGASVTSKQPRITTPRRRPQEPDRNLALYDGRVRLASISYRGDQFFVVMASGVLLGTFDTLKQACAEVSAAHGGGR
jgi:hypothetical protein